jgi:hypothetical protein
MTPGPDVGWLGTARWAARWRAGSFLSLYEFRARRAGRG